MQSTHTTSNHYTMHESQESPTLPISTPIRFFPVMVINGNNGHYSPEIYEFGFLTAYDCYGSYTDSSSLTTDTEKEEKETEVRMVKGKPKKVRKPRTFYSSLQLCVLQSRLSEAMPPRQQETPCDSPRSSSSPQATVHWGLQNHGITDKQRAGFMPPNTNAPSFYSNYSWYSSTDSVALSQLNPVLHQQSNPTDDVGSIY
ncbi:unnamed protein product [Coregonus sp. 'balchen']|nr:unnamed protein product [Coregonus sp. 'balchen']